MIFFLKLRHLFGDADFFLFTAFKTLPDRSEQIDEVSPKAFAQERVNHGIDNVVQKVKVN